MLNRRTVITFEKLERSYYHFPNLEPVLARCAECRAEVSWLTPNQVAALTGLTLREIFRRIESHTLHFDETPQGLLHICPNSLSPDGDLMVPGDSPEQDLKQ
jgi:hypothetical protein